MISLNLMNLLTVFWVYQKNLASLPINNQLVYAISHREVFNLRGHFIDSCL